MITWLKGIKRVKSGKHTREIHGYRCSKCNEFVLRPIRVCPNCGDKFNGVVQDLRGVIK